MKPHEWIVAAVLLAVFAGEGWWWRVMQREAALAMNRLAQVARERNRLSAVEPALSEDIEARLMEELTQVQADVAARHATLQPGAATREARDGTAEPLDAVVELARFVGAGRRAAHSAGVGIRSDEEFGFSHESNRTPDAGHASRLAAERRIIGAVLQCLFAARPLQLIGLKRESPSAGASAVAGDQRDFFALTPALSLRRFGWNDTAAIQVEFIGSADTARAFLDGLARAPELLFVRALAAEPPRPDQGSARVHRSGESNAVIAPAPRRFVVTVESVALPDATSSRARP